MPMIAAAAIGSIGVYQKYISPYKGFRCAHRVYCCGSSCSEFAQQAIRDNGLLNAIPKIRRRFCECREAYVALQRFQVGAESTDDKKPSPLTKQGDCCVNVCTLPCL